ncbi:MAG: hypothetical protein U1E46_08695 [Hyphomicrobiales bacterium]
MAFEELKAQIATLLEGLEDQPEDPRELYEMIREKLEQLKAMGLPLPADLVELEKRLEADFETPEKDDKSA